MNEIYKLQIRARNALYFLDNHPALGYPIFNTMALLGMSIHKVCKRGYCLEGGDKVLRVYYNKSNYKKYKKEFDKEFKNYSEEELKRKSIELINIDVTYKKMFGEDWKFDHIEYWMDIPFVVFKGDNEKEYSKQKDWHNYQGVSSGGKSFEEAIINLSKKFKNKFGNWCAEDFFTLKEKNSHKENEPFLFKPSKSKGYSILLPNPKYKNVSPARLNKRWLEWFKKTEYAKKNWTDEFKINNQNKKESTL